MTRVAEQDRTQEPLDEELAWTLTIDTPEAYPAADLLDSEDRVRDFNELLERAAASVKRGAPGLSRRLRQGS